MVKGWFPEFWVVQSSSEYCPGRGLKKNFKNFFWKVWSWWKSPYLCSRFPKRSGRSETFWLMCFSSFADEACRSFLLRRFRKKVWKKVRKDLEGICKSIYLCIRFRLVSGAGKREAKRVLKDIERFETNSKCESENKFDGYNDWAKEILLKSFITMKSLILAQDER